jgi:CelD/BcsL family acetyltransferase involved in cellulose biosynthesis
VISCPIRQSEKRLSLQNGVIVYNLSSYEHHYVDTQISFEEYQKKFKSKTRSTLKRKVSRFSQNDPGLYYFRKFRTPEEIDSFVNLASLVSVKTYQHRLFGRGIPDNREFCLLARKQAELGLVYGYLLYFDGKPIAYTYAPAVNGGVLLYDYNGYDPDHSNLSPGTVMQYKIIEDLCSDPDVRIYDLCTGEDDAKRLFSTGSMYCADILILRKSLKNMFLVMTHFALTSFSRGVGKVLRILNLKSRLKRYIRRNAHTIESSQVDQV